MEPPRNEINKIPPSLTGGCCEKGSEQVWYYGHNVWRFDYDQGIAGPKIKFCPFCGKELAKIYEGLT